MKRGRSLLYRTDADLSRRDAALICLPIRATPDERDKREQTDKQVPPLTVPTSLNSSDQRKAARERHSYTEL